MRALSLVVFAVLCGSACGYADPLSQNRYGGVLALTGDESQAMDEARRLMTLHCGRDNFEVTRIEEVVVDEEDYVQTITEHESDHEDSGVDVTTDTDDGSVTTHDANGSESGRYVTETRAGTTELIETHVSYRCVVPTAPPLR